MPTALLATDIEGSTRLVERAPRAYATALARHHALIREAVTAWGGTEFHEAGDGFFLAFPTPTAAAGAAIEAQKRLAEAGWPEEIGALRVRMALHWAKAEFRDGQYRGPAMHLTARLLSAGHGGQVLCSGDAAVALEGEKDLRKLGTFRVRGFEQAVAIFQLNGGRDFPALHAEQARRHNLPRAPENFIGRREAITEIKERLDPQAPPCAWITLTGPGGVGKTQLALMVAHDLLTAYDHAIYYVELATLTNPEAIPAAMLEAVGENKTGAGAPLRQVGGLLAAVPALFVLDNFEHLAAEGVALMDHLRSALPKARFLLTSRARLGGVGEQEHPVGVFAVPPPGQIDLEKLESFDSVRLLLACGNRARTDFRLTSDNAESIAEMCRLLDGMPLAIEIAAARLQVLTASEVCEGLRQGGTGDDRLEVAFQWSLELLPPQIADFLTALSVFRGGWTVPAATEVAEIEHERLAVACLHYLLTCSLIQAAETQGRMRFRMLEPIRQMADRQLGEKREEIEVRHREYFRRIIQHIHKTRDRERETQTFQTYEPEFPNFLVAIDRQPKNERRVWWGRILHSLMVDTSANRALRPRLTTMRPDGGPVKPDVLAFVWEAAGHLDAAAGELESAVACYRKAEALFLEVGQEASAGYSRINRAGLLKTEPPLKTLATYHEFLAFYRKRGENATVATILSNLTDLNCKLARYEEASLCGDECLTICDQFDLTITKAHALLNLAYVEVLKKDWARAYDLALEYLDLRGEISPAITSQLPNLLHTLGCTAAGLESWQEALFYFCLARKNRGVFRTAFDDDDGEVERAVRVQLSDDECAHIDELAEKSTLEDCVARIRRGAENFHRKSGGAVRST